MNRSKRVLVVGLNPEAVGALRNSLNGAGINVEVADDYLSFVFEAGRYPPAVAVIGHSWYGLQGVSAAEAQELSDLFNGETVLRKSWTIGVNKSPHALMVAGFDRTLHAVEDSWGDFCARLAENIIELAANRKDRIAPANARVIAAAAVPDQIVGYH